MKLPLGLNSRLRIVNVGYLNSVPYRYLQKLDWVAYEEDEPSECARRLHERECDLALLPFAEFLVHGGYSALSYGIASQGPVDSVFLFSEKPIDELDLIAIDDSSRSSAMLLRLILAEDFPQAAARIRFARLAPDEAIQEIGGSHGALVIGDRAFKLRSRYPHQLDLAAHWLGKTSLPFVFAVWGARPDVVTPEIARELELHIEEGLKYSSIFARDWADQNRFDRGQAEKYIEANVFHKLTDSALKGALQFSHRAAKAALLPRTEFSLLAGVGGAERQTTFHTIGRLAAPDPDAVLTKARSGERLSVNDALVLGAHASPFDLALGALNRENSEHAKGESQAAIELRLSAEGAASPQEMLSRVGSVSASGTPGPIRVTLAPGITFEELAEAVRALAKLYPGIPIRGLDAGSLQELADASGRRLSEMVQELAAAGMCEILGDDCVLLLDSKRSPLSLSTRSWLALHRLCHRHGLRSSASLEFRSEDSWDERVQHLLKLRQLQDETRGFISFRCLCENPAQRLSTDNLRFIALCRLFLDNFSQIKCGPDDPALSVIGQEFGASGS